MKRIKPFTGLTSAVQVKSMLETVKKPHLHKGQPPQLWSLVRTVQMSLAGFAFLYLLGYGWAGHKLQSRSPRYQATAPVSSSSDTDDALVVQP
ncbi:MAG: hypothetical protein KME12_25010 [Trichocoleus desertorum ATA4-8-CV12]|jgi:hypothetical protein|nr:hypothetical protein [Trichocoleus desertorum ATA4-8-CV12]